MSSTGTPSWDPSKMFDVSAHELELIKKRKEMSKQRKAEFRRLAMDPSKQGKGGHIVSMLYSRDLI